MVEVWFRCPRCNRVWNADDMNELVSCICHLDCDYCGLEQTLTITVSRTLHGSMWPTELDPHPWGAYLQCSNCGYYSAKPPVDALPTDEAQFDEP